VRGFSPGGEEVGRVEVPARMVTSLCFGGVDRRDLFIVTADNRDDHDRGGTVFHTRVEVAGCPIPLATV
jgi:sugar lactone lactonase YvrE